MNFAPLGTKVLFPSQVTGRSRRFFAGEKRDAGERGLSVVSFCNLSEFFRRLARQLLCPQYPRARTSHATARRGEGESFRERMRTTPVAP